MKILMLCEKMECGGAETHVLSLSSELVMRGHSVCVLSAGGRLVQALLDSGVEHTLLPLDSHAPLDLALCRAALPRIVKSYAPDVIHSHSRLASFCVAHIAKRRRIPFVATAHAKFRLNRLHRLLARWGERTVAVSEDIKQYLIEGYSLAPDRISVIPNGVDTERFFADAAKRRGMTIAFLSRMDGDCSLGAALLCEIAPRLCRIRSDIKILIGGGGSDLKRVRGLAERANREIGRECVVCVGKVDDSANFLQKADIFVGVSRAAIEAALCGCSIVLCGNEGFGGIIDERGFTRALASNFCARGDVSADGERLYSALCSLLQKRDGERAKDAESLRCLFAQHCSICSCAAATEDIYCRVISERAGSGKGMLLCGYYGFDNMGDDILLRAAIARARREYSQESVRALTRRGSRDSRRFGLPCTRRASPIGVLREILRCKRLVYGGGTLLQNRTSRRSLIYYSAMIMLARLLGRECVLWGNGIGRVDGRGGKALLRRSLECCWYIGVRDLRSYAIARHLADCKVVLEGDLAESFSGLCHTDARTEFLLRRALGSTAHRFVIAAVRSGAGESDRIALMQRLSELSDGGLRLLAIAMKNPEEMSVCLELWRALGAHILSGICFDDLVGIAKHSEGVYSMRYHALVAAHLAGVSFVGVGETEEKLVLYCREHNCEILSGGELENIKNSWREGDFSI